MRVFKILTFFATFVFFTSSLFAEISKKEDKPMPPLVKALYSVSVLPAGVVIGPFVSSTLFLFNTDGGPRDTMNNYYHSLYGPYESKEEKQKWHEDRYKKAMEGRLWKEKVQEENQKESKPAVTPAPTDSSLTKPAQ